METALRQSETRGVVSLRRRVEICLTHAAGDSTVVRMDVEDVARRTFSALGCISLLHENGSVRMDDVTSVEHPLFGERESSCLV